MVHSVLGKAQGAIRRHPEIPYIVIEDALPEAYYRELAGSFPSDSYFAGSNDFEPYRVHRRCAFDVVGDERVPAIWREFFEYHTSQAFFEEICALWRVDMGYHHPTMERVLGKPAEALTIGRRFPGKVGNRENENYDLVLDCQFSINRSAEEENMIRGPHLDSPRKLFNGLLYMRAPDDRSFGGDLEFFRLRRRRYPKPKPSRIDEAELEQVDKVEFKANTLVMFLNSAVSIHGVTPRSVWPVARRYVNLLGECYGNVPFDFFTAPEPRAPVWYRWVRHTASRYL